MDWLNSWIIGSVGLVTLYVACGWCCGTTSPPIAERLAQVAGGRHDRRHGLQTRSAEWAHDDLGNAAGAGSVCGVHVPVDRRQHMGARDLIPAAPFRDL